MQGRSPAPAGGRSPATAARSQPTNQTALMRQKQIMMMTYSHCPRAGAMALPQHGPPPGTAATPALRHQFKFETVQPAALVMSPCCWHHGKHTSTALHNSAV